MAVVNGSVIRGILILAVLCLATSSLGSAMAPGDEIGAITAAESESVVTMGWLGTVHEWNPMNLEFPEDFVISPMIYSSLFTYDRDNEMVVGDLARSWAIEIQDAGTPYDQADDFITLTVEITQNAYWRNAANIDDTSHPVTANDVKFTYDMIIDENEGAWPMFMKGIVEIDVVNDWTLEITTDSLKATILDDLACIPIVPEYIWLTYSSSPCVRTMSPEDLVGCGPFVFDAMLVDTWVKLVRAPNYHQTADFGEEADIDFDGILFVTYGSAIELVIAMNSGSADAVVMTGEPNLFLNTLGDGAVSPVIKAAVQENGIADVAINAIPFESRTSTYGNGFELLVDPILREAILMCLDKDFVNEELMNGLTVEANSVLEPGYWHLDPVPDIPFDPAAARAMLEANGYADTDGDGLLECVVTNADDWRSEYYGIELDGIRCQAPNTDPSYISIAMLWAGCAVDAGIGLVPEERSEGIMVSTAWYKADYDIWVWHWGWGPEPLSTLSCWLTSELTPGGNNCQMPMGPYEDYVNEDLGLDLTCYYDGSIYDQVWTIAGQTMDMEERKALICLLQQWVYDSRCEYPPYYDLGLYGYSEAEFTNWGDWESYRGMTFMSGLPWLWFDIEPLVAPPNSAPAGVDIAVSPNPAAVGEPVVFVASAMDADGDPITITLYYGDGTYEQIDYMGDTTVLNYFTFEHTYVVAGDYSVTLTVEDWTGLPGHVVSCSDIVQVTSDEPSTIVIGMLDGPSSLNPFNAILPQDEAVMYLMYDTLASVDPYLNPGPRLADYWVSSVDATVWEFVLNDDAMWHDGVPVTASDVVFTFDLILSNPSDCILFVDYLEYLNEMIVHDDHTVEIVFSEGRADFASVPIPILPEHLWSNVPSSYLDSVNPFDTTYFPDGPVGSGPLVLKEFVNYNYIRLEGFDQYHMGPVNVDTVLYKIFSTESGMVDALMAGTIDVAMDLPESLWIYLVSQEDIDGQSIQTLGISDLGINCASAEWRASFPKASTNLETTNRAVRQAIAMCVDTPGIVDMCLAGLADPGTSLVPVASSFWHYDVPEEDIWNIDLEAAMDLLSSAGYEDIDSDGIRENVTSGAELTFEFFYRTGYVEEELAAMMISDSLAQVGMNAPAVGISEAQLFNEWMSCSYDLFLWGWTADADPSFILSVMTTDMVPISPTDYTKWSDTYYSNPVYDSLYEAQKTEGDRYERQAIVHEMQRILYEDSPYVVLWHPRQLCAYGTDNFVYPEMETRPGVTPYTMWFFLELMPSGANLPPRDVYAGPDMTVDVGTTVSFSGYAYDPDDPLSSLEWEWVFREASGWGYAMEGQNVEFTFFNASTWSVTLTVTDPSGNSAYDTAVITVVGPSERTLQYRWHDMFNVPFGEWWEKRELYYGNVEVVNDGYPNIFKIYDWDDGEEWYYTNMRLDILGSSMPEFSMTENPVFLPFLGDTRGGNAEIDWHMQYMTDAEIAAIPDFPFYWNDGWVVRLNGTVTLDLQAAMAVLGLTTDGYEDFEMWWSVNGQSVAADFSEWMDYEGNERLDIYNMYEYPFSPLRWTLDAEKVGDDIVLMYDHISWGMDALMARWLRDAFVPTEWYFEDMSLYAQIGPDCGDLQIFTAVDYAAYAYTGLDGSPCWVWEAMLQDYVESSLPHPDSDFDDYADKEYLSRLPGSPYFGDYVQYDYTPGSFELGVGETMSFTWPSGYVPFYQHMGDGMVMQALSTMNVDYLEPSWLDMPGSVMIDNGSREIEFAGPIDMAVWSESQTAHDYLASEWDRLGILPYGMPYIEFSSGLAPPNEAPIASFTVSPGMGAAGTEFLVDASSSWDPDNPNETLLVKWDWESDGVWDTVWSSSMTATHVYDDGGWYTISLAVMDSLGATGYDLHSVLVDATDPIADAGPDQTVLSGTVVVLDGTASVDDFSIASYSWLFIDGGALVMLSGPIVTYMFTDVGTYIIVLEVTDMVGNTDSDHMVLIVESPPEPVTVAKLPGGLDSTISWTFVGGPNCSWALEVTNYGLSRLDVDVVDMTMGGPLLDETLRFTQSDYWYSGPLDVREGHVYEVTLRPFGMSGSYAVVTESFESFYGIDYVYSAVEGMRVRVCGSSTEEVGDLTASVREWLKVEVPSIW